VLLVLLNLPLQQRRVQMCVGSQIISCISSSVALAFPAVVGNPLKAMESYWLRLGVCPQDPLRINDCFLDLESTVDVKEIKKTSVVFWTSRRMSKFSASTAKCFWIKTDSSNLTSDVAMSFGLV